MKKDKALKINVWGGISYYGTIPLKIFE